MKHATVMRDGYEVPLIGIPQSAVISACELCGKPTHITKLYFNGKEMVCETCCKTPPQKKTL